MSRRSIQSIAKRALAQDEKLRETAKSAKTTDSLQNFAAQLGIGTSNMMSGATYGFNPISRNRVLLEWIHRGTWLGGVAIDLVADDMTRAGVEFGGILEPEEGEHLERAAITCNLWGGINDCSKWARLYGGSLAVMMIDGQKTETPLRLETVGKNQFKGLLVLDRWMVEPSLNDLVTEMGPDQGLPKYYTVTADAPALPRMKIHYSRCLRLEGVRLPYWQRLMENLWGISVIERLYDRMVAFDSATTGAAQLVYKSFIRTYKVKGMREIIAQGKGNAYEGLLRFVEMMRMFQGNEGITLLDGEDEFDTHSTSAFSGLSDALLQFGQQLSGALQIPLVRLFGQSPAGLNSTGDSDLRTYYDGINNQQNRQLRVPVTKMYRALAQSEGIKLPEGFIITFRPLWQLTDPEKAEIANKDANTLSTMFNAGVTGKATTMKELRQGSRTHGRFSNVDDADIKQAEKDDKERAEMQGEENELRLESQRLALENPETEGEGGETKPGKGETKKPNGQASPSGSGYHKGHEGHAGHEKA